MEEYQLNHWRVVQTPTLICIKDVRIDSYVYVVSVSAGSMRDVLADYLQQEYTALFSGLVQLYAKVG